MLILYKMYKENLLIWNDNNLQLGNESHLFSCTIYFRCFVACPEGKKSVARLVDKKVEEMEHFALADMRQIIASICKRRSTTEIESKKGSEQR